MGKSLRPYQLLTAVYGYYDIFYQTEQKKLVTLTPKLPNAALHDISTPLLLLISNLITFILLSL